LISQLGLLAVPEIPFSIAGRINFLGKYNASNELFLLEKKHKTLAKIQAHSNHFDLSTWHEYKYHIIQTDFDGQT
jgi:hypothetical protein